MLIWQELLVRQACMDRREGSLIMDGSLGGLDMGDELRRIFITGLGKMHFVPHPQGRPFLAITGIKVIGRVDELGCRQGWLLSPLSSLLSCFKLLFPNGAQRGDGGERFHPVWCGSSIQHRKEHP